MSGQAAILISFIIYLAFFGWLGWRRGARREITVFFVALVAWLLLQEAGGTVISIANLGGAAVTFAREGGFGGSQAEAFAALGSAPDLVSADGSDTFLFVLWIMIFVGTYAITNSAVPDKDSHRNGWAALFGALNGLFFAMAFVPSLLALFAPDGDLPSDEELSDGLNIVTLLGSGLQLIWDGIASLWSVVESIGSLGLVVLLTLLLVLAATSIRGGAKVKS